MDYLAAIMLMLTGVFLIMLVLVQRGRGGGLAGAFGGMGGQSAFGTKAGDVFTRITVIAAVVWVTLAGLSILAFSAKTGGNYEGGGKAGVTTLTSGENEEGESGLSGKNEDKDAESNSQDQDKTPAETKPSPTDSSEKTDTTESTEKPATESPE